jgi:predicted RNA-binding Zn ribbon-like protein
MAGSRPRAGRAHPAAASPASVWRRVDNIGAFPAVDTAGENQLNSFKGNVKDVPMPEHRAATPPALRDLESFLWWDFEDPATWAAWARARGFSQPIAMESFTDAGEVQSALRRLQAANAGVTDTADAAARLNRALLRHDLRPHLTASGELELARPRPADPVGRILQLVVEALASGVWRRFKLCRDPECRASYFDASKNGTKTWCSMDTCGSRNKMRRFRERETSGRAKRTPRPA